MLFSSNFSPSCLAANWKVFDIKYQHEERLVAQKPCLYDQMASWDTPTWPRQPGSLGYVVADVRAVPHLSCVCGNTQHCPGNIRSAETGVPPSCQNNPLASVDRSPQAETWAHRQHASRKWHHRRRLNTELLLLRWVFIQMRITFENVKAKLIFNQLGSTHVHLTEQRRRPRYLLVIFWSRLPQKASPCVHFPHSMARISLPTVVASLRLSSSASRHVFHVPLRDASVWEAPSRRWGRVEMSLSLFFSNQTQRIETEMMVIRDQKQTDFTCLESNEASSANVTLTHLHNKSILKPD